MSVKSRKLYIGRQFYNTFLTNDKENDIFLEM